MSPAAHHPRTLYLDAPAAHAVSLLRAGRPVVLPTDTLYALAANALRDDAVRRVRDLKRRDEGKPMPVLVSDEAMARRFAAFWPPRAALLAARFWPGPLTIVVRRRPDAMREAASAGRTIGLRAPDHDLTRAIIEALDAPIVGTSANRAGDPNPTDAASALASLGNPSDLFAIDDGPARAATPSTVIDLTTPQPRILREGAIPPNRLGL